MVQNTSAAEKKRGRPPKFDRDQVIDAAIGAFWTSGLDGTTLPDLEAATGIDRSTLYSSFGGKQGLYDLATRRYLDNAEQWLFAPLAEGTDDGRADVLAFLHNLRSGLTTAEIGGCLVINNIARNDDPGPGERYRALLGSGLRQALSRTTMPDDLVDERAAFLGSAVIGVNLMSAVGAGNDEIALVIDGLIRQVDAW